MNTILLRLFLLLLFFIPAVAQNSSVQPWSYRIADSFIALHPDSIVYPDEEKSKRWNYEQGLMLEAFYQMWVHSKDERYKNYLRKNLDHYIRDDGSINTYVLTEFNIDNIAPGKPLLRAFHLYREQKYKWAADTLRRQLSLHPRTSEGGFWHKKIYPNQMWLDGLYMAEPFYTLYAATFGENEAFDDIAQQFLLIARHAYDKKTGLYFHGWDESKTMGWADKETGCSPNIWGRSLGWYAVALVDVLDHFPAEHPKRKELLELFRTFMTNVLKHRDEKSKVWYQVVDQRSLPGNYPEASASTMLTYAFAKGANRGYLPTEYKKYAMESFSGVLKQFVTTDKNGRVFLKDVVKVSGLGGKPYRDGSIAYYLSEPRRTNDFKGYGSFLLAAIEIEKLQ